jgi:hypothetical protein
MNSARQHKSIFAAGNAWSYSSGRAMVATCLNTVTGSLLERFIVKQPTDIGTLGGSSLT